LFCHLVKFLLLSITAILDGGYGSYTLRADQPKKISAQNMHNRYKSTEREFSQKSLEQMLN